MKENTFNFYKIKSNLFDFADYNNIKGLLWWYSG